MAKRIGGRPPIYGVAMEKFCATFPRHLLAVVDEIAAERETSRSRVLRDALTEYVEHRSVVPK